MEELETLEELCKNVSGGILESLELLKIIEGIYEDDPKIQPLTNIIIKNLQKSFKNIEKCRTVISVPD